MMMSAKVCLKQTEDQVKLNKFQIQLSDKVWRLVENSVVFVA